MNLSSSIRFFRSPSRMSWSMLSKNPRTSLRPATCRYIPSGLYICARLRPALRRVNVRRNPVARSPGLMWIVDRPREHPAPSYPHPVDLSVEVDESPVTGESVPVRKGPEASVLPVRSTATDCCGCALPPLPRTTRLRASCVSWFMQPYGPQRSKPHLGYL